MSKKPESNRSVVVTFRMAPELKKAAMDAAAADSRPLSSWLEKLVRENLPKVKK